MDNNTNGRHYAYLSLMVRASTPEDALAEVNPLIEILRRKSPKTNTHVYKIVLPAKEKRDRRATVFVKSHIESSNSNEALKKMRKLATKLNSGNPGIKAKAFLPKKDKEESSGQS